MRPRKSEMVTPEIMEFLRCYIPSGWVSSSGATQTSTKSLLVYVGLTRTTSQVTATKTRGLMRSKATK